MQTVPLVRRHVRCLLRAVYMKFHRNLCHDLQECLTVNTAADGSYSFKALCTINGFWMDEWDTDYSQPSPKWLADLQLKSQQPGIWTEDQGWFNQWYIHPNLI